VKCFIEQLKLCLKIFSPMSLVCIKLRQHYPQQASTMYYKFSVLHFYKMMSYCTDVITLHNSHESNQGTEYWPKKLLDVFLEFETTSHIHWLSMSSTHLQHGFSIVIHRQDVGDAVLGQTFSVLRVWQKTEGENVDQWFFSVNFYETLSRQSNAIRRDLLKCLRPRSGCPQAASVTVWLEFG
jgi:hypothetical protein